MATLDGVRVADVMSRELVTFAPEMDVLSAIHQLVKHNISGAPVVDPSGQLIGILSERDCLKVALAASYENSLAGAVSAYMTTQVVTVEPHTSLTQVASLFLSGTYKRFPVVDGGRLIGQISRSDIVRAISEHC